MQSIPEDQLPFKKRRLSPEFVVNAADILYEKTDEWRLVNALREANQKRIMNAPQIKRIKRRQEIRREGIKMWVCPRCDETVRRLTAAHVGPRVILMIRDILKRHPTRDFIFLDDAVRTAHRFVKLAVCCDKCNKDVEISRH